MTNLPNTAQLLEIMAKLRDPNGGCPWDLEQNFATIAPYTIEEAYEVADAIARGDKADLREELGDLLLQVVFHSQMAKEEGSFTFEDVAGAISDKMLRRHPHVFGDAVVKDAAAQTENWEQIKAGERKRKHSQVPPPVGGRLGGGMNLQQPLDQYGASGVPLPTSPLQGEELSVLDNIPSALPALMRAQKLQSRVARVGFEWPDVSGVIEKIREELLEVEEALIAGEQAAIAEELGDLLFAVVNLARFQQVDAEEALRAANQKFTRRFHYIEAQLRVAGKTPAESDLNEMGALWDEAKKQEHV